MKRIGDLQLYVGVKEEFNSAKINGMKIVVALNRASGFITHQSLVGWTGKWCPKDHPNYLVYEEDDIIALNMIDGDDYRYISDDMINPALEFIKSNLDDNYKVFIYCSLGKSRSPSIVLMYLLESGLIKKDNDCFDTFRNEFYSNYNPRKGVKDYIINKYLNT
jgi:hypothetical protein